MRGISRGVEVCVETGDAVSSVEEYSSIDLKHDTFLSGYNMASTSTATGCRAIRH